ncbi:MAG: ABC transporter ATP-binding protein [Nocardioidaceae bacterium]|nr:MAG: ABC transporter ATP-binding protein [Nocardioidaceae bacterium]
MLQLVNLTKKYRDAVAVRGVDLTLQDGEFFALVGPSGSGKTSILAMVSGYIDPTSGSILQDGEELTRLPPAARNLGIVFQDYALFPHMTARNNVAYGLKRRHWGNRQEISKRVNEMLDVVGLVDLGERYPRELSGGQQQRVAIARALAYEPKLLLMDEPLGALDRAIREDMQRVIIDVHHQLKPTILYVTHNRGEAYAMADRVGVMRDGLMVAADAPTKLRMEPRTAFIASFFGGHNLLPIKITGLSTRGRAHRNFRPMEVESFPGQEGLES